MREKPRYTSITIGGKTIDLENQPIARAEVTEQMHEYINEHKSEMTYFSISLYIPRQPKRHDEQHLLKLIDLGLRNNLMNDVVYWTKKLRKLRSSKPKPRSYFQVKQMPSIL